MTRNAIHPRTRIVPVATATLVVAVVLVAGSAGDAGAAPGTLSGATFEWSVSDESNTGAYNGSCNFMSAGQSDGSLSTYAATNGNVTVLKLNAAGEYVAISDYASRCLDRNGVKVTASGANRLGQKVRFTGGTGTLDPATGAATIQWTGTFSLNFYGELIPFWIKDPLLVVGAGGTGIVTATLGGYASSMDDPTVRTPINPVPGVVIATLSGVSGANLDGFTTTPAFTGVTYESPATPQNRVGAGWGSWPTSFVDFHGVTGLSGYWYSTGGAADLRKPPAPITVDYGTFTGPATSTTQPPATTTTQTPATTTTQAPATTSTTQGPGTTSTTSVTTTTTPGGSGSQTITAEVPGTDPDLDPDPDPDPDPYGTFSWTISGGGGAVSLGLLPSDGGDLRFSGELKPVVVTDTRAGSPSWSMSGQVSDFTGGLSGRYLGWIPKILQSGSGAVPGATVPSGISAGDGLRDPSLLASAPAGHAPGTATVGADLDLRLPASTPAGSYSATLTITALG